MRGQKVCLVLCVIYGKYDLLNDLRPSRILVGRRNHGFCVTDFQSARGGFDLGR